MEAAMELFANEGYHNISISKIAKSAGISKGLMYNYFESKEQLVLAIIDKGIDDILDLFDPNHDGILTDEEFESFVRKSYRMIKDNVRFWRLYFALFLQPSVYHLISSKMNKVLNEALSMIVSYFSKKGIKDPVTEALIFGAMLDGIAFNFVMNPRMFPLEKVAEHIIKKYNINQKEND